MNTLSNIICRMSGVEDLTHVYFVLSLNGSRSAGSFYKAIDNNFYYKLSYPMSGYRFCYESVNEVLVSRLCTLFGFNNAGYKLIHAKIKMLGFPYYDEIFFLDKFKGRSVMDDFSMHQRGVI